MGSRARGDQAYEATQRVVRWLSWKTAFERQTNPWVELDKVRMVAKRVCRLSPAQVELRLKLLVEDGLLESKSGFRHGTYAATDALTWTSVHVQERKDQEAELKAEVDAVLVELGLDRETWNPVVEVSRGVQKVKFGGYYGVPAHEALLLLKMARRGNKATMEWDRSDEYVVSINDVTYSKDGQQLIIKTTKGGQ